MVDKRWSDGLINVTGCPWIQVVQDRLCLTRGLWGDLYLLMDEYVHLYLMITLALREKNLQI